MKEGNLFKLLCRLFIANFSTFVYKSKKLIKISSFKLMTSHKSVRELSSNIVFLFHKRRDHPNNGHYSNIDQENK